MDDDKSLLQRKSLSQGWHRKSKSLHSREGKKTEEKACIPHSLSSPPFSANWHVNTIFMP